MLEINNFFAYFRAKRKNFCAKHAKMKQSSFSNGLRRVARVDENGNSDYFYVRKLPSVNKGKHACQRVFPSLFVLFALAGARPPASQKPKIARISIAGRCGQFCRSRNASRQGKARREYCRIVKGLDAVWAYFCPSKPCLPLSTDGIYDVCVSTP